MLFATPTGRALNDRASCYHFLNADTAMRAWIGGDDCEFGRLEYFHDDFFWYQTRHQTTAKY